MKGTEAFKETIKKYLDTLASTDTKFKESYENKDKNIEDCITYILNTVKKAGANGYTDQEIYGMAIHYYDEASIDIGEEIKMQVKVNHHVELTEEERKEIKAKAVKEVFDEEKAKMRRKPVRPKANKITQKVTSNTIQEEGQSCCTVEPEEEYKPTKNEQISLF